MTFVYTPPEPVAWRLEFFNGKLDMFTEYVGDAAEYGENAVPLVTLAKLRAEVERVRRETVEACLNCYSPDDTATDWADKIKELLK